ncbi:hypothetical protein BST11_15525 [Mycobacterium alsense]|uniref:Uncharacterized protein n=1 Tax=Mycobacterium alsense TaxID=324058 RepID=A0ABX3R756_9MYCO|nr:hypothetical protein BST11_15525 [Mycobacterium alsense]
MASDLETRVIFLESHPAWVAVQRDARERIEAMRRHPSSSTGSLSPPRPGLPLRRNHGPDFQPA